MFLKQPNQGVASFSHFKVRYGSFVKLCTVFFLFTHFGMRILKIDINMKITSNTSTSHNVNS